MPVAIQKAAPQATHFTREELADRYLGDRNDMRADSTNVEKFEEDLTSFRVTHRYDWLVAEPGDASNVGAYVALRLAS